MKLRQLLALLLALAFSGSALAQLISIGGVTVGGVTGTGNAVLSNGATLISPNLGTPASGNGVNITNVNAASVGGYTIPCDIPALVSGDYLTNNGTTCSWAAAFGGGVTSVSVVTANGLSGTVANPGTTPAITLAPTFTGIPYSNGSGFAAAIAANFPTLNQNTTGTSANITASSNSTLATLSALSLPSTQVTGLGTFATQSYASPPAIGGTTPAAGAFTTLSASGAVSGTGFSNYMASPPAIGGTAAAAGHFTTLSASGQLTSTVSTGTAPFVVASTTQVANLQAATAAAISTTGSNGTFWGVSGGVQGYYTPAGGGNVSNTGTPTAGQFAEWTSSTVIGGQTLGGDCTLSTATITCTKTSGTAFGTFATQNFATPPAIGGTTPAAGAFTTLSASAGTFTAVAGGVTIGSPTGGAEGAGTLNMAGCYINGVACGSGGMVYPGAGIPVSTGSAWSTSITPGTGVATALGANVGSAGAVVVNGGALGTPSSGSAANLTSFPTLNQNTTGTAANITATSNATLTTLSALALPLGQITGFGTGVATALGDNVGSAGAFITYNGAAGTPSALVCTNCSGTASSLNIGGTAGNLSGTPALPNGTTATTQTTGDSTTKLATDAFVIANAGGTVTDGSGTTTTGQILTSTSTAHSYSVTWSGIPIDTVTGTSYTVVTGDNQHIKAFSNASAIGVSLPAVGTLTDDNFAVKVQVLSGAGTVTVTPTTSTIALNGGSQTASISLTAGQSATIYSDKSSAACSTNGCYWAIQDGGGSSAFSALTSSTNTTAAMLVGTDASLGTTGSGTISATSAPVAGITGLGTGVATFLATPSSANFAAAVTGETGTGAVVFGTSPTLTTPALGTPSALVCTNCSGTASALSIGGNAATATTAGSLSGSITLANTPLTTLGDLLYANATPALARLAGYTTANTAVLTQTGTGSVSAAPAWSNAPALSAANMTSFPTLNQNTTGTAANVTATSNSTLTTLTALSLPYSQVTSGPPIPPTNATTSVGTTAIGANTCTTATTVTMTGLTTSMTLTFTPTSDTSGVTGWGSTGGLVIRPWPTANTVNYKVCNQTASSITPSASVTFNVSAR